MAEPTFGEEPKEEKLPEVEPEQVETPEQPTEEVEQAKPEIPEVPEADPGEPGGDDPQAVRARKEYRLRKRTEELLQTERMERIRHEERLRLLEEQRAKQPEQKPQEQTIYTIAQVNAAVEAGTITRQQADQYIEDVIFPARIEARIAEREKKVAEKTPIQAAEQAINEYKTLIPDLGTNKQDPKFIRAGQKYWTLVSQGFPPDARTELTAMEIVYGDLETVKKRMTAAPRTPPSLPSDAGGGASRGNANNSNDFSRAPAHLVEYWNRTGTPEADRKAEFAYWKKQQASKRA